jgi:hypothetical protein
MTPSAKGRRRDEVRCGQRSHACDETLRRKRVASESRLAFQKIFGRRDSSSNFRKISKAAARGTWSVLDSTGHIDDPALAVPLPIEALIRNAKADDSVARALLAKRNPVLVQDRARGRAEGHAQGRAEGHAQGKAEAVIVLLTARDIALDSATRERILGERDVQQLDRWIVRAATCATLAELLTDA